MRRRYASADELLTEILARKGKSIVFELSDVEVERYCRRLQAKAADRPSIERHVWTVWLAAK